MPARVLSFGVVALASVGVLAACGGDDGTDTTATTAAVEETTTAVPDSGEPSETTVAVDETTAGETTAGEDATDTVDANTATVEELAAAFEAAGIPQADRWAREVEEYRPYPTDDPTFAHLVDELSKYNPSDEVLQAILDTLTL